MWLQFYRHCTLRLHRCFSVDIDTMQDFHYFSRKPGELDVRESNDGRGRHGESRKLRESGRSWNFVLSVQNLSLPLQIFSGENVSYKYFADDSFVLQY